MKTNNKKQETKNSNQKSTVQKAENNVYADSIVLKAIGYPFNFNFNLMETNLEITDKALFEEYAKEQWLGLVVKEGSYLFDQKIIPDYGFKIISATPNKSIVSENTKVEIINEDTSALNDVNTIKTNLKISDVIGQENAKNKKF